LQILVSIAAALDYRTIRKARAAAGSGAAHQKLTVVEPARAPRPGAALPGLTWEGQGREL
jgi:hypothetical protein